MFLRFNANKHEWDRRYSSALAHNIIKLALIVGDSRAHLALERFHRENLDSHVDTITHEEREVLDKEIISDECVLAELNFNCYAVLNEICLIITEDRCLACGFYLPLLLLCGHRKRLTDQLFTSSNPVAHSAFIPEPFPQQTLEGGIHVNGAEEKFPFHSLFFGDLGATLACIHASDDRLNLLPKGWLVNEKKLKPFSLNLVSSSRALAGNYTDIGNRRFIVIGIHLASPRPFPPTGRTLAFVRSDVRDETALDSHSYPYGPIFFAVHHHNLHNLLFAVSDTSRKHFDTQRTYIYL